MLKHSTPFTRLLLATALVALLPACSDIGNLLGSRDRNDGQVVDGPRRKPVLNPSSASHMGTSGSLLQYDGYVPPSYAAEPVPPPPSTYASPEGHYYDVPLPSVAPIPTPTSTSMQGMAYTQAVDVDDAVHAARKPFPHYVESVEPAAAPQQLANAELMPLVAEMPAPTPTPTPVAQRIININTHSVVAEPAPAPEVQYSWFKRLLGLGSGPSPTPPAPAPMPVAVSAPAMREPLLASAEYPDLHTVPPNPPALRQARKQAPLVKQELQTDHAISSGMQRQLNDEVEADKPNSLREEMERNALEPAAPPPPVPLVPPARPHAYLPPPSPPQGEREAFVLTAVLPPTRNPSSRPTIEARGALIDTWYVPASMISVGVVGGAAIGM